MDERERKEQFLKELSELTRKHKMVVGGCGCCNSPFLDAYSSDEELKGEYRVGRPSEKEIEWEPESHDHDRP